METAINLIKKHEALRLEAYKCPAGVWTIGWGHTRNVRPGDTLDPARANRLLHADVAGLYDGLRRLQSRHGVSLNPRQQAALVSFAYNVGFPALRGSTLWRLICENPAHPAIPAEFARWKYARGKVMPGLVKRRAEEAALYQS